MKPSVTDRDNRSQAADPGEGVRYSERTGDPPTIRRQLTSDERAMLDFVVPWLPYGELPLDEVFVAFGLSASEFTQRVHDIVTHHRADIHPRTALLLMAICTQSGDLTSRWVAGISGP